jgi:hypothetical protein
MNLPPAAATVLMVAGDVLFAATAESPQTTLNVVRVTAASIAAALDEKLSS